MSLFLQDFIYAVRSLRRHPHVALAATLSLALGIGVNVAIFSVFERLLLRHLPVSAPTRLVNVLSPGPRPGSIDISGAGTATATFSYPLFRDLERVQTSFAGVAAHRDVPLNLTYREASQRANAELVSGGYFTTLALRPAIGRLLGSSDDRRDGQDRAVVLSHGYWMRRFGGDPTVVNATAVVNGRPATIVGVAPEGFQGTTTEWSADVFVPLSADERFRTSESADNRQDHWLYVFARLQNGVSAAQAEARLAPLFSSLITEIEYPAVRSELHGSESRAFLARRIVLEDGSRGSMSARPGVRLILTLLFVVTGLVLLIACANVANLLTARMIDRSAEVAVRQSLGASTVQVARLVLTEACVLGLAGSIVAIGVARLTIAGALALVPADSRPPFGVGWDLPVLLFALALGLGTGLIVGLFPAVETLRNRLAPALSSDTCRSTGSRRPSRLRTSLAVAQIALATALLAEAGLLVKSLSNVLREDLGIERQGLITFGVNPGLNGYPAAPSLALFEHLEDRLAALPGVSSVTAATIPLLANGFARNTVSVQGFASTSDGATTANYTHVGPAYFKTLGIPLMAGREFTRADNASASRVAIVNQSFARKFGLGRDAVGKRMGLGRGAALDIEIVGLVADAKYESIRERSVPQFFLPYRQVDANSLTFYVRSRGSGRATAVAVLDMMKAVDAQLPVENLRTMEDQIGRKAVPERVLTTLASSFALLATILAGVGLYAVLAYAFVRRQREIGVRVALGARAVDVYRLVFGHVARLGAIGCMIGLAAAISLGRVTQSLLFGVDGLQAAVLAVALGTIVAVMMTAAAVPARRATRIDPAVALRAG